MRAKKRTLWAAGLLVLALAPPARADGPNKTEIWSPRDEAATAPASVASAREASAYERILARFAARTDASMDTGGTPVRGKVCLASRGEVVRPLC
jgi:hypothetical protein